MSVSGAGHLATPQLTPTRISQAGAQQSARLPPATHPQLVCSSSHVQPCTHMTWAYEVPAGAADSSSAAAPLTMGAAWQQEQTRVSRHSNTGKAWFSGMQPGAQTSCPSAHRAGAAQLHVAVGAGGVGAHNILAGRSNVHSSAAGWQGCTSVGAATTLPCCTATPHAHQHMPQHPAHTHLPRLLHHASWSSAVVAATEITLSRFSDAGYVRLRAGKRSRSAASAHTHGWVKGATPAVAATPNARQQQHKRQQAVPLPANPPHRCLQLPQI